MTALQIRSMPPDLHEWLARTAEEQHRSINQQALVMLKMARQQLESSETLPEPNNGLPGIGAIEPKDVIQKRIEENRSRLSSVFAEIQELNKRTGYVYPDHLPSPAEMIREDRDR